jgi:dolichyl-diphosphooligosaccharide--protein glycosyltransferase
MRKKTTSVESEKKARLREERQARRAKRAGKEKERDKEKKPARSHTSLWVLALAGAIALSLLFVYSSLAYDTVYSQGTIMNGDWRESLEWMGNRTPDPGVNYYGIFDRASFTYPPGSYGVMSWWDYGHQITFIARRIPNANPFQAGVAGPNGAAAYFMTQSEDYANSVADLLGTRYVITDIEMDSPKFWAMATWFNASVNDTPYNPAYYVPDQNTNQYQAVKLNNQSYYETMVSRLHNFDGSMGVPSQVYYIQYQLPEVTGLDAPLITQAQIMTSADALNRSAQYNRNAPAGSLANVVSQAIFLPVDTVPALRHYRLVHESPVGVFTNASAPDIKYVKVFEYVKGAHIKGQGVIAIDLVTNEARRFTYRQQSMNGEWIVPYSTDGNPYEVHATGTYRIEGTSRTINVPEQAVMQGLTV